MKSIARRYTFPASHRLQVSSLSDDDNIRLFGKCNNPFGHGHNYTLSVTCVGEIDARTGMLAPLSALDRLVTEQVLSAIAYRNLNVDVPQFLNLVPTTENLAIVIAEMLVDGWDRYMGDGKARLHKVHLQETDRNSFEVVVGQASSIRSAEATKELVHA